MHHRLFMRYFTAGVISVICITLICIVGYSNNKWYRVSNISVNKEISTTDVKREFSAAATNLVSTVAPKVVKTNEPHSLITNLTRHIEFMYKPQSPPPKTILCNGLYTCSFSVSEHHIPSKKTNLAIFLAWKLSKSPPQKLSDQLWIMKTGESQRSQTTDMRKWNGYFNYTHTFKPDGDIPGIHICNITKFTKKTFRNFAIERKSPDTSPPTAAWFVSKCATRGIFRATSARVLYAVELSKWMNLQIFTKRSTCKSQIGKIAPNIISQKPKNQQPPLSNFHFYLAFENSLCKDYITEKLWKILRGPDLVIPIVMGGLDMREYERIAPPNSYIHVKNFTSPKHLAEHLKYVVEHEEAFNYYLQWRNEYELHGRKDESGAHSLCPYCTLVHQKPQKVYNKISDYFNQSQCLDVTDRSKYCKYYGMPCSKT